MNAPIEKGKTKTLMIEFVDTHTHLFVPEFDDDRTAVVQRAVEAGVSKLCLPSINSDSLGALLDMCNEFPGVFSASPILSCVVVVGSYERSLG